MAFRDTINITYKFTVCEVPLGIIDNKDAVLEIINLILLMGKMHIYHSKQNKCPISFIKFLTSLKYRMNALKIIYEKEDNNILFMKKYHLLIDNL